jgi:hypothetical protein
MAERFAGLARGGLDRRLPGRRGLQADRAAQKNFARLEPGEIVAGAAVAGMR